MWRLHGLSKPVRDAAHATQRCRLWAVLWRIIEKLYLRRPWACGQRVALSEGLWAAVLSTALVPIELLPSESPHGSQSPVPLQRWLLTLDPR
jgi:hypothetical protein